MSLQNVRKRCAAAAEGCVLFVLFTAAITHSAFCGSSDADDIYWSDCFIGNGLSARALAVKAEGGDVYAGGQFGYAGGLDVDWIARWDGASWHQMGEGFSGGTVGAVYAIETHDGYVYAGGNFTHTGELQVNYIARWDGFEWSELGNGTGGTVYCMAVYHGDLYVGGNFTSVDNDPSIQKLARWDGSDWHAVAEVTGGSSPSVMSMAADEMNLYVGGKFAAIDSVDCLAIARWDGKEWYPLGGGLQYGHMGTPAKVKGIAINGTDVYAAGEFMREAGTSNYLYHVGKWNGTGWSSLGSGLDWVGGTEWDLPWAEAVACIDASVYVGGCFNRADTCDISWLAMWDGAEWQPLGSGVNNLVAALDGKGGDLHVGGAFGQAGGHESACIAIWNKQYVTAAPTPSFVHFSLEQNIPNPFNPTTMIRFDLPREVRVKLCVYNVKGELIATLVDQHMTGGRKEIAWTAQSNQGNAVASGIYFYRLVAGEFVQTKKMVLLR